MFRYVIRMVRGNEWIELSTTNQKAFEEWKCEISKFCILNSFYSKYQKLKTLGQGSYGIVYLVEEMETKQLFAAKAFINNQVKGKTQRQFIVNEIKTLRRVHHENIMKIYDVHETMDTLFVVLEYIEGEELFELIKKTKRFKLSTIRSITQQLLLAISYLEDRGVVHRDLKPENIMVVRNPDSTLTIKIADFGLSERAEKIFEYEAGTAGFMAPEIINYKKFPKHQRLTSKMDIYSLGCILFHLYIQIS